MAQSRPAVTRDRGFRVAEQQPAQARLLRPVCLDRAGSHSQGCSTELLHHARAPSPPVNLLQLPVLLPHQPVQLQLLPGPQLRHLHLQPRILLLRPHQPLRKFLPDHLSQASVPLGQLVPRIQARAGQGPGSAPCSPSGSPPLPAPCASAGPAADTLPFQLGQPPLELIAALLQLPLRPLQLLQLHLVLVSDPLDPIGRKDRQPGSSRCCRDHPSPFPAAGGTRAQQQGHSCPTGDPGLFPQVRGKLCPCELLLPALTLLQSSLERCSGDREKGPAPAGPGTSLLPFPLTCSPLITRKQ